MDILIKHYKRLKVSFLFIIKALLISGFIGLISPKLTFFYYYYYKLTNNTSVYTALILLYPLYWKIYIERH